MMATGNPFADRDKKLRDQKQSIEVKPQKKPQVKREVDSQPASKKSEAQTNKKKLGRPSKAKAETYPKTLRLTRQQIAALRENTGFGKQYADESDLVRQAIDKLLQL